MRILFTTPRGALSPPADIAGKRPDRVVAILSRLDDLFLAQDPAVASCRNRMDEYLTRARDMSLSICTGLFEALGTRDVALHAPVLAGDLARECVAPLLINRDVLAHHSLTGDDELVVLEPPAIPDLALAMPSCLQCSAAGAAEVTGARVVNLRPDRLGETLRPAKRIAGGVKHLLQTRPSRLGSRPPGVSADVLMLCTGPTVVAVSAPVATQLASHHAVSSIAYDLEFPGGATALARASMPAVRLREFVNLSAWSRALWAHSVGALGALSRLPRVLSRLPLPAELDREAYRRGICRSLMSRHLRHGAYRAMVADATRRLLDTMPVRAIVSLNWGNIPMSTVMAVARERDLPVIFLQHGIAPPGHKATDTPFAYDQACVFGPVDIDTWQPLTPKTEFMTTGHPALDPVIRRLTEKPPEPINGLRRGTDHVVLLATQPEEPRFRIGEAPWLFEALADICAELGAHLVIKTHPREQAVHLYEPLATRGNVTLCKHSPDGHSLDELIATADVVVIRSSTVALEAGLQGRPVIMLETGRLGYSSVPYDQAGLAQRAATPEELRVVLADALHGVRGDSQDTGTLQRWLGPLDGHAAQRAAQAIAGRLEASTG